MSCFTEGAIDQRSLADTANAADENRSATLGNEVTAESSEEIVSSDKPRLIILAFKPRPCVPIGSKDHAFDDEFLGFDGIVRLASLDLSYQAGNEFHHVEFRPPRPPPRHD